LRLGRKFKVFWNTRFEPALHILSPNMWKIELPCHWQAALFAGQRHANSHLAVILLAQYAAILTRHHHRVIALLGKSGVINNSESTPAQVHVWNNPLRYQSQHLFVTPLRFGYKVMHRLVSGSGVQWIHPRRHGLHAFARERQHQAGEVSSDPCVSVSVARAFGQVRHVALEFLGCVHHNSAKNDEVCNITFYDTVRLRKR